MYKETISSYPKKQIEEVKRILKLNPFIVFITFIVGGFSLAAGSYYFGQQLWFLIGSSIFTFSMSICVYSVNNAKLQYNKLLEELKK